jgi:hypothetical protein
MNVSFFNFAPLLIIVSILAIFMMIYINFKPSGNDNQFRNTDDKVNRCMTQRKLCELNQCNESELTSVVDDSNHDLCL